MRISGEGLPRGRRKFFRCSQKICDKMEAKGSQSSILNPKIQKLPAVSVINN
jgi:hypothetical protein